MLSAKTRDSSQEHTKDAENGDGHGIANVIKDVQDEQAKFKDAPDQLVAYMKVLNKELHTDKLLLPSVELIGISNINSSGPSLELKDKTSTTYIGEKDQEMLDLVSGKTVSLDKDQDSILKTSAHMKLAENGRTNSMDEIALVVKDVHDAETKFKDAPDQLAAYMKDLNKELHSQKLLPEDVNLVGTSGVNFGGRSLEFKDSFSTTYVGPTDKDMLDLIDRKSESLAIDALTIDAPKGEKLSEPMDAQHGDASSMTPSAGDAAASMDLDQQSINKDKPSFVEQIGEYWPPVDRAIRNGVDAALRKVSEYSTDEDIELAAKNTTANLKNAVNGNSGFSSSQDMEFLIATVQGAEDKFKDEPDKLAEYMKTLNDQLHSDGVIRADVNLIGTSEINNSDRLPSLEFKDSVSTSYLGSKNGRGDMLDIISGKRKSLLDPVNNDSYD